jgi:hypothetical protein
MRQAPSWGSASSTRQVVAPDTPLLVTPGVGVTGRHASPGSITTSKPPPLLPLLLVVRDKRCSLKRHRGAVLLLLLLLLLPATGPVGHTASLAASLVKLSVTGSSGAVT